VQTIEIAQVDRRYEGFRMKDSQREAFLYPSIQEQGILEPILGASAGNQFILLDGFKRYRIAKKLKIEQLPYFVLAEDAASAMIQLIRISNSHHLHILEQASLVDILSDQYHLSVTEIAQRLERSVGWVSMRLGVLKEIPENIQIEIFNGRLPAYHYLYTLRQFMRMKQATKAEVVEYVKAVAGQKMSTRNLDLLARAFFQGNSDLRKQILEGKLEWSLQQMKAVAKTEENEKSGSLNQCEIRFMRDLQIIQKYLSRTSHSFFDKRMTTAVFPEGNLLSGGILRQLEHFIPILKRFYDQSR